VPSGVIFATPSLLPSSVTHIFPSEPNARRFGSNGTENPPLTAGAGPMNGTATVRHVTFWSRVIGDMDEVFRALADPTRRGPLESGELLTTPGSLRYTQATQPEA
jgi:hypothetical protein